MVISDDFLLGAVRSANGLRIQSRRIICELEKNRRKNQTKGFILLEIYFTF
jgi:hypothetical protein